MSDIVEEMEQVFVQKFSDGKEISCYYGTPPKSVFGGDVIRVCLSVGDDLWITPDEASTLIRALSAGLSHYLVDNDALAKMKEIV